MPKGIFERKPRSEAYCLALSLSKRGSKHPRWKGGKEGLPKCHCGKILSMRKYSVCQKHVVYTEKRKKNMGLAQKGRRPTLKQLARAKEVNKGNTYSKGIIRSNEFREKVSKTMHNRREKSHLWKGGITPINQKIRQSFEYRLWREAVFARDNWTCRFCGRKGCRLEADHIKQFAFYPELRFAIDNGRTLCKDCHKKTNTYLINKKL